MKFNVYTHKFYLFIVFILKFNKNEVLFKKNDKISIKIYEK